MLEFREREILSTLEKLKEANLVLIGGYAVNAYAQPRFSVDCDIVVMNKEEANRIRGMLEKDGYAKKDINLALPYTGEFLCLTKKAGEYIIPFDILIGSVIDRGTGLHFPAEWIFENSGIRKLVGKANPIKITLRVANPEVLIVMKLAAGRKSDIRDVFMLFEGNIDTEFVLAELRKFNLTEKLKKFKEYVLSADFKDSLQGVFGKVDNKLFNSIISKIDKLR